MIHLIWTILVGFDDYGNIYTVGFTVLNVLRDGNTEPYHIKDVDNGKRIYIGSEDVFIPSGEYTYTIKYKTDRQLGFFKDHDELYWNVTGNGWEFPIEHAAAAIKLPGEASSNILSVDAYTCPQGAKGNDFTSEAEVAGGGSIFIKLKEISCRARNNISN